MKSISLHPNPIFERENWQSLNGEWDFGFSKKAIKNYKSLSEQKALDFYRQSVCTHKINVPFCIESALSGIGYTGFLNRVWYKKRINITPNGNRVFLHIGAADYKTTVILNGKLAGSHKGGYTPMCFDITDFAVEGENELYILCEDNTRDGLIASGKQSNRKKSYACSYTRTTGIWQSVYIEYTPNDYVKTFKLIPSLKHGNITVELDLCGTESLEITAYLDEKNVGAKCIEGASGFVIVQIPISDIKAWELGNAVLYDLEIKFGDDKVSSYFGLRDIALDGFKFMLNGKSVFQRTVLDQGFYRKGIYTAENDEELKRDIALSMALGFNGARLHQKVFDPRFLYFCDCMGYMVWGEYANWGLDYSNPKAVDIFLNEWGETLRRDYNHPAIIGWCPFNETWNYRGRKQYDPLLKTVYEYTKEFDRTRPCIDTSGNFHVVTDIYDVHDYRGEFEEFRKSYEKLMTDGELYEHVLKDNPGRQKYNGEPVFISEYGGIKWESDKQYESWGYGNDVKTEEEWLERYKGLTETILDNARMLGFCYTQLYDVEQEQNGLYTYDREKKFSEKIYEEIKKINTRKAAIEL
ncbi:MAG: glycoside hydrolase family 2 protein [Candidatus Fimenecus sp.]